MVHEAIAESGERVGAVTRVGPPDWPGLSRLAVLGNPGVTLGAIVFNETHAATRRLGLEVLYLNVRAPEDFDVAFETAIRGAADALLDGGEATVAGQRMRSIDFASRMKLPLLGRSGTWTAQGASCRNGPNSIDSIVARPGTSIRLCMARRGDLPIEQPTVFELIVNVKTARALS
jgi:putative ABC transport system substrate-binding protein